jgi:hypothetical protein
METNIVASSIFISSTWTPASIEPILPLLRQKRTQGKKLVCVTLGPSFVTFGPFSNLACGGSCAYYEIIVKDLVSSWLLRVG